MVHFRGVKFNQWAKHSTFKAFCYPVEVDMYLSIYSFKCVTAIIRDSSLLFLPICYQGAFNEPTSLHKASLFFFFRNMAIWLSKVDAQPSTFYDSFSCSEGRGVHSLSQLTVSKGEVSRHRSSQRHIQRQETIHVHTHSSRQSRVPDRPRMHVFFSALFFCFFSPITDNKRYCFFSPVVRTLWSIIYYMWAQNTTWLVGQTDWNSNSQQIHQI